MPTYTSNYGWTKPSGSDNVDISVLNNNLDGQDGVIHDAFLNMAPPFSESSTYAVDDIVLYTTGLYKCHTAVVAPGSWTGSTNWQVYKLSEGGGGSSLTAGDYIDITAGVISVTKEKGEYSLERYVLQSTGGGAPKLVVKKYIDSELISTNEYANNTAHVNIDDTLEIWYSYNPYNWHYKLLVDGVDHSAGYEYEFSYTDTTEYPVDFHISAGDSTDLVTKSDLTADNVMMSDGVTSVEEALDEVMSDKTIADGIQPTLLAGQHYGPGCYYFKIGCFIYLYLSVLFDNAPFNTTIFVLPDGYKPLLISEISVSGGESYNAKAQCIISANGSVTVTSADKYVSGSGILLAKAST